MSSEITKDKISKYTETYTIDAQDFKCELCKLEFESPDKKYYHLISNEHNNRLNSISINGDKKSPQKQNEPFKDNNFIKSPKLSKNQNLKQNQKNFNEINPKNEQKTNKFLERNNQNLKNIKIASKTINKSNNFSKRPFFSEIKPKMSKNNNISIINSPNKINNFNPDDLIRCNACQRSFEQALQYIQHTKGKKHKKRAAQYVALKHLISEEKKFDACFTVNKEIIPESTKEYLNELNETVDESELDSLLKMI